jgi:hypothetical protein
VAGIGIVDGFSWRLLMLSKAGGIVRGLGCRGEFLSLVKLGGIVGGCWFYDRVGVVGKRGGVTGKG